MVAGIHHVMWGLQQTVIIRFQRQMHDKYSQLKTFRALAELRSTDETLMRGATFVGRLTDNGFTISRFCYNTTGAYGNVGALKI